MSAVIPFYDGIEYDNGSRKFNRDEDFTNDGSLKVRLTNKTYRFKTPDNLKVSVDLGMHGTSEGNRFSPRINIIRNSLDIFKNQEMIWTGDIVNVNHSNGGGKLIVLKFNTGQHSEGSGEWGAMGVILSVSGKRSDPAIERQGNNGGQYRKWSINQLKELEGNNDFKFIVHKDEDLGNLLQKGNVTLRVRTFLEDENKRKTETFLNLGEGEFPWWTLEDDGEIVPDNIRLRGSKYVVLRHDGVDTNTKAFSSVEI